MPNLAELRTRKGISLQDIASATKIAVRYLQAIERGEYHKLPGGVYDINYIRQYARAVQYDESRLLDHYRRVLEITN